MPNSSYNWSFSCRAPGGRPVRLRKQIFANLEFNNINYEGVPLIVPQLIKNCISDVDFSKPLGAVVNFRDDTLNIHHNENSCTIKLHEGTSEGRIRKEVHSITWCKEEKLQT